jgi:peroxiredoxin
MQSLGASLVAISPQLQQFSQELVAERRLPFEVLGDPGLTVAQSFGVAFKMPAKMQWAYRDIFKLDLPHFNGDDSWMLPMPARYVVDRQAVIRSADVNLDHTRRPEVAATLDVLRTL